MSAQTALLLRLSQEKGAGAQGRGEMRSVIRINPHINWPVLGDDDAKVDRFVHKFESTIGLANDGRGMQPSEKLITLGQCLKQARLKVYELIVERSERSGKINQDPQGVYEEIIDRLMEFSEGTYERQARVRREWDRLQKGRLSGLQFLPQFEGVVDELERVGLARGETELYLAYVEKVGAQYRNEILKDRRIWGGSPEPRTARTWREAHRILIEQEALETGSRSFVAATGPRQSGTATRNRPPEGGRSDGQWSGGLMASTMGQAGDTPGVCYRKRDHGECDRPNCPYNHDPKVIAAARAEKARERGKGGGGKGKSGPAPYHAWGDAGGRPRDQSGSGKGGRRTGKDKGSSRGRSPTPHGPRTGMPAAWGDGKGKGEKGRSRAGSQDSSPSKKGKGGKGGGSSQARQPCLWFLKGNCRYGADCHNSHSRKSYGVLHDIMATISADTLESTSPARPGRRGKSKGGGATSSGGGGEQYMWGHGKESDTVVMGPLWDGPVTQGRDMVALVGPPRNKNRVNLLRDLPVEAWRQVPTPSSGYNYRIDVEVLGEIVHLVVGYGGEYQCCAGRAGAEPHQHGAGTRDHASECGLARRAGEMERRR